MFSLLYIRDGFSFQNKLILSFYAFVVPNVRSDMTLNSEQWFCETISKKLLCTLPQKSSFCNFTSGTFGRKILLKQGGVYEYIESSLIVLFTSMENARPFSLNFNKVEAEESQNIDYIIYFTCY